MKKNLPCLAALLVCLCLSGGFLPVQRDGGAIVDPWGMGRIRL